MRWNGGTIHFVDSRLTFDLEKIKHVCGLFRQWSKSLIFSLACPFPLLFLYSWWWNVIHNCLHCRLFIVHWSWRICKLHIQFLSCTIVATVNIKSHACVLWSSPLYELLLLVSRSAHAHVVAYFLCFGLSHPVPFGSFWNQTEGKLKAVRCSLSKVTCVCRPTSSVFILEVFPLGKLKCCMKKTVQTKDASLISVCVIPQDPLYKRC